MTKTVPFTHLHMHTHHSNNNMFESVSSVEDYIEQAKAWNIPAMCLSNHGMLTDWVKNKKLIEAAGLKYVHAIEAYVTDHEDKKVRDNYHLMLIAKNWEGVKEINKLSSRSWNREDNHFHYNPRMYRREIFNTSDNIIILTACLGSPLRKSEFQEEWKQFLIDNKHRVWLEVQPHEVDDQKEYNKFLIEMAEEYDMNIVGTNDVHHVNEAHANVSRAIKHEYKKIRFDDDDTIEAWYKSREEMVESFQNQGVLTDYQIDLALNNTAMIIDQIEGFELDLSHKYPSMFDYDTQMVGTIDMSLTGKKFKNSLEVFKHIIMQGYVDRGINNFSKEKQDIYKERVLYELETYVKTGSVDYMLLEWSVKKDARDGKVIPGKSIKYGYGRGSVSGSLIAYLLRITEMDSIRHGLSFERFMNPDRISLADIDSDWSSTDQKAVQNYLINHPKLYCYPIVTKNRMMFKKALQAYGAVLGYSKAEAVAIGKKIKDEDDIPRDLYEEHKELFDKSKQYVIGTIESFGRHAAGIVVSSVPIDEAIGIISVKTDDYTGYVTALDMKDIDYLNFVKLDVLGLNNIELIEKAGELAGVGFLTPDSTDIIDFQDEKVWQSMAEDNIGIFQFESDRAGKILEEIYSKETLERVKNVNPDVQYIDLLSIANAGQRPSGASYIEAITAGKFKDNGHQALNKFLANTMGQLVYQEQQTQFLVDFCGWTKAEADLIRRGIGNFFA